MSKRVTIALGLACASLGAADLILAHHAPCNIHPAGQPVVVAASLAKFPAAAAGEVTVEITDYAGRKQQRTTAFAIQADGRCDLQLDLGRLEQGYYELRARAVMPGDKPVTATAELRCIGVLGMTTRSAEQALAEGSRFGLKTWQLGKPGVWWRRPLVWRLPEATDACADVGLQWTRHPFNQDPSDEPGKIGTVDLIAKHRMNVVMKVEGFPESCFDAGRYGPIDDWKTKKKDWQRKTVPLKEPYQAWLRERIALIPTSQRIFEIGNEVWDKMPPEDFALLNRMSIEAIRQARPDAIIGPNSAMGPIDFEMKCIKAGGYEGIDMLTTHPYSFTPLPEHRVRGWLRNYRDFIKARLGREIPLYVTEYGWSTAPQDPKYGKSERQQAQLTVRESLMLYAEDCKAIIPHWMADREHDPKEREHWFGFLRLNMQPKPVFIAHAISAQMIDGSTFVGDLDLGPDIGAMLFERGGRRTLALWTLDEKPDGGRMVRVPTDAASIDVVELMGARRTVAGTADGIELRLHGDVTYVVGVGPAVASRAIRPGSDAIDTIWLHRSERRDLALLTTPTPDGDLAEWAAIPVVQVASERVPAADASAVVQIACDDSAIYLAATVQDDVLVAAGADARDGDALILDLCPRPDRQPSIGGFGALYDYAITVHPPLADAAARMRIGNVAFDSPLEVPADGSQSGIRWAVVPAAGGWRLELAIPRTALPGFPTTAAGSALSARFRLHDRDAAGGTVDRPSGPGGEKPREWCLFQVPAAVR